MSAVKPVKSTGVPLVPQPQLQDDEEQSPQEQVYQVNVRIKVAP
jgi:hypothetical protein